MPEDAAAFEREQQRDAAPPSPGPAQIEQCPPAYRIVVTYLRRAVSIPFESVGAWCRRRWDDPKASERWSLKKDSDEAKDLGDLAALWVNTRVRIDPNTSPGFFLAVAILAAFVIRLAEQVLFVVSLAWAEGKADGQGKG